MSSGTHKPKDPPWLALVQSESKKKKAPPPPGLATLPNIGSLSSPKGEGSRPRTPPVPANPFEEDDDEEENAGEAEGSGGGAIPPPVVAGHPWYRITQAPDETGADPPPRGGSSSRSASPGSAKSKKRAAPRAPHPPAGPQGQSDQQLCSPLGFHFVKTCKTHNAKRTLYIFWGGLLSSHLTSSYFVETWRFEMKGWSTKGETDWNVVYR